MATKDYTWLQGAVASFVHRTDIAAKVADFVTLAEDRLNMDVDNRLQESLVTLSTVAGFPTVALPDGATDVQSISIPGQGSVDYLGVGTFNARYDTAPGLPRHYTVIGDDIYLGPTPDSAYDLKVVLRSTLMPLADAPTGQNWLIAAHPSLYLAATMCEVCMYTKDTAALQVWEQKYQNALSLVNGTDSNVASSLAIRPDTKTP
jgi:hypothetical protein